MNVDLLSLLLTVVAVLLAIPQTILAVHELLQRRKERKVQKDREEKTASN